MKLVYITIAHLENIFTLKYFCSFLYEVSIDKSKFSQACLFYSEKRKRSHLITFTEKILIEDTNANFEGHYYHFFSIYFATSKSYTYI